MTSALDLPTDYAWPTTPLEVVWGYRYRERESLRTFVTSMDPGPTRSILEALQSIRAGAYAEALAQAESLLAADELDELWTVRALQMRGGLLQQMGLSAQSVEVRREALAAARRVGHPSAILLAWHDLGVSLERTDGRRAQQMYLDVIHAVDSYEGAPVHVRAEMEALRALAVVNRHLLSDRTGLPMLEGTPDLASTEERARPEWPNLAAAIRAFRGLNAYDAGDTEGARAIFADLPDPLTMNDTDHAIIVATAVARRLVLEGRHDEALAVADGMLATVPRQFLHEVLDIKTSVYEDRGDYRSAYAVAREIIENIQALFGEEAKATVRALEVFYQTDAHRAEAEAARRTSHIISAQAEVWRRGSLRDPLTDVWNRRFLQKRLEDLGASTGHQLAVLDLDGFKPVNDVLGHAVGDEVLIAVARALSDACGADDVCVRHGGDEFCVLRPADVPGDLAETLSAVCRPFPVPGSTAAVTLSIGVTTVDADGFDAAFDRADQAMYAVKRDGGAGLRIAPATGARTAAATAPVLPA